MTIGDVTATAMYVSGHRPMRQLERKAPLGMLSKAAL